MKGLIAQSWGWTMSALSCLPQWMQPVGTTLPKQQLGRQIVFSLLADPSEAPIRHLAGTSLGLPSDGTVGGVAQVSLRRAPQDSARGLPSWVCPQNTDRVSSTQGSDPHTFPGST